jgi:signal transduction histidine kinase
MLSAQLMTLKSVRNTVSYTKIGLDSILAETAENLLLEKEGLIPAIHQFVESLKDMMQLNDAAERIIFNVQDVRENLPFRVRVGFYNIAREGILNMVRHSGIEKLKEGHCKMSFYESNGTYHLLIEDNGIGFSPETKLRQSHSFGLRDMYFQKDVIRRHCTNADIQIDSAPQNGTRIHIWATQ